ncbi:MAG TPA: A24 family peptidase [Bryobacteraceae bacterium]|nr:A24 family peptidase [Bryobacteraceae bacterium]
MSYPPVIVQVLLLLVVIPAALFDYRQRRVPNWITFSGVAIAIGLNFFLYETPGLFMSLKGLGLALLIYFPLFAIRGMGAGDVKLMGAIGAAVGWQNWLGVLVLTSAFGGVAAIIIVASRGRLRRTFQNIWLIVLSLLHRQAPYELNPQLDVKSTEGVRLPHAVAIAFGTIGFLIAATIWAPR